MNDLKQFRTTFENELRNILAWWIKFSVEKDEDGFYGAVNLEGKPVLGANKSCVLNTRILWTFSAAAKLYNNTDYRAIADKAFKIVTEKFADKVHGGFFMELAPDNSKADDIKHTYAQAFAIYSLCKYSELEPSSGIMDMIQSGFYLLEEKTKDSELPGYF